MNSIEPMESPDRRGERGAALLVTMLLLTAMALIGFASLNTVMRDREASGYTAQASTALLGADAALAHSFQVLREAGDAYPPGHCLDTPVPTATLPNGVTYGPDATASPNGICMMAVTGLPCPNAEGDLTLGIRLAHWNLRTQGVSPGGASGRIEALAERCQPVNVGGY